MAVNGDADSKPTSNGDLRHGLITSSTKRRITELSGLQHQVAHDGELGDTCSCDTDTDHIFFA
jgi:hypothetical protein